MKKAILLFTAAACLAGVTAKAQQPHCYTDEVHARIKNDNPAAVAAAEARLKAEIDAYIGKMNLPKLKTTAGDDDTAWKDKRVLHIPVVFHVVHDYGSEWVTDNVIYQEMDNINRLYRGANPDTNDVIATYKGNIPGTTIKYIANTNIQFHLAKKDPAGQPTNGITRRRDFTTNSAGDHAKFDVWPREHYLNIWVVNKFDASHATAAAYALKPSGGDNLPWYDGPITYMQSPLNYDNTLAHEIGHFLNLDHPWGGTNAPEVACGDDDVDDTPPTDGHAPDGGCSDMEDIWDTNCILTAGTIGKAAINPLTKITDALTGHGIRFNNLEKVYIDNVSIYPADSGKPFTIVLKHKTGSTYTQVASYSGITANNKQNDSVGLLGTVIVPDTVDQQTGEGITFKTYDSVYIRSVKFFTDSAAIGMPYSIVLKRNNTVINTHSGTVTDSVMVAALNFGIQFTDTNALYKLEFAVNPGAKRQVASTSGASRAIPGIIRLVTDTSAQGLYNYFYNWRLRTFSFRQNVAVRFVAPVDTTVDAYSLEFSVNPGMHRDLGSASGTEESIPNIMTLTDDTTNGMYNYFYSWVLRYGDYFVNYPPSVAKALFNITSANPVKIDYPDTTNSQNVMDYTYCSKMFTYLQGVRMRAALRSNVAGRNNLIDTMNLIQTGVMHPDGTIAAKPDIPPVADFVLGLSANQGYAFTCKGSLGSVRFNNKSWNDTVTSVQYTFSNQATPSTHSLLTPVNVKFDQAGWVTVNMIASSNAGSDTLVSSDRVYVADDVATSPNGYFQEFNGPDLDKYPIFNHFNNYTKWEVVNNTGFYDNTSMRYKNFDPRMSWPALATGTPRGDYDDFYTPAFNLNDVSTGNLYLTFFTAGAFRTNNVTWMNDTLEVSYSNDCGGSWKILKRLTKNEIGNNGVQQHDWTPSGFWEYQPQNILLSSTAITTGRERVFFRFRYKPGVEPQALIGSGNNFYLDRIHIGKWTTDVQQLDNKAAGITLAPNPTNGNTYVLIKDAKSSTAQITVTDVAGKLVYTTQANLNGNISRVEIPASYITVKGMYMVSVVTGAQKHTEKLIVY